MRQMTVVDDQLDNAPRHVWDAIHEIFCMQWGQGNDQYGMWEVGNGDVYDETNGPIIDDWCKSLGIEDGTEIIIKHWW